MRCMMNKYLLSTLALSIPMVLSSCGGGSGSNTSGRGDTGSAVFTLKVTDAAIDSAAEVWIQFTAVELKPEDGDSIVFDLPAPEDINLLALTGSKSEILIDSVTIESGSYEWIRLDVNADEDGILDSYIRLNDGSTHELRIPSGATTGLMLNRGFVADTGSPLNFTIDFDLRRSIVVAGPDYLFSPVLNLIDDSESGTIEGSINGDLLTDASCSDSDPTTGNAVYLFEGDDVVPDDIDNIAPNPYSSTIIELNASTGEYEYEFGFVPEGEYTLAFTCQSDLDDINSNDTILFNYIINDISVEADDDITVMR